MPNQNQEIFAIIIIGCIVALLLVGFIVTIVFLYQKRQNAFKKELAYMEQEYNQQLLNVQFEMQEAVLSEVSEKLHHEVKNNIDAIGKSIQLLLYKKQNNTITYEQGFEQLNQLVDLTFKIKEEVRLTSHSLMPERIQQVGFVDAIEFEIKRQRKIHEHNLEFIVTINKTTKYYLGDKESIFLFRLFQEIIGNVITHSKATRVNIDMGILSKNIFELSVTDNGVGFNYKEKKKSKMVGVGLMGLQQRASQINATFIVDSTPNIGTAIKIQLPLQNIETTAISNNDKPAEPKAFYNFD